MKTSYILLAIIAIVTLTGMVATDVLLKQQYEKIDWKNPYQNFEQRLLPEAKHWVVEGTPTNEIVITKSTDKSQAFIEPDQAKFYRTHQQGDTVFVAFTPDYSGYHNEARNDADRRLGVKLVLQLSDLQTLQIRNARLTLLEFTTDTLAVDLQKSRLRTDKLKVSGLFTLNANQNSFAVFGPDQYKSLHVIVQDSSGIQLNNTKADILTTNVSPKSEIQLRGQALTWLK